MVNTCLEVVNRYLMDGLMAEPGNLFAGAGLIDGIAEVIVMYLIGPHLFLEVGVIGK